MSLLYVLKASKSGFVKKADVKRKSLSALALVFIFILHAFVFFYSAVNLPKLFFLQIEKENLGGVLAVLVFMYIFLTVYAAMVWNIKNVFLLPVILIIFAIVQETLPSSFSEVLKSQVYLLATLSVFGITLAALTAGIFIQSLLSISVLRKS